VVIERDSILLVIDVQVGSVKSHMEDLASRIGGFAREWALRGGLEMVFKYVNEPGSACERFLDWREMYGPPETDLVPELRAWEAVAITRTQYSAVTEELKGWTETHPRSTVLLCGIDTAACIQKTALDLFEQGVHPYVLADLCASGDGVEMHEAAIAVLRRAIGVRQVGTSVEALKLFAKQNVNA
jgi:nicotinamidase-related amidase